MWGAKLSEHPKLVENLGKIMLVMGRGQDKEADQRFLWLYVWPITQFDTVSPRSMFNRNRQKCSASYLMQMTHDSYFCERWEFTLFGWRKSLPFPTQRAGYDFVGSLHLKQASSNTTEGLEVCPVACRPTYGQDWNYC